KKSKIVACDEGSVRGEILDRQLSALLVDYAMPKEWVAPLSDMLDREAQTATQTASEAVQGLRERVAELSRNLARLTDVYVAQDIERDDYLARRRALMSEKKSVEEKIDRLLRTPSAWIEPTREWIKDASRLDEIAKTDNAPSKKISLQKIFGSNLTLHAREAHGNAHSPYAALRAAKNSLGETDLVLILEPRVGIGPTTSSFAYTFSPNAARRRARLYLCPKISGHPCQSFGPSKMSATVLAGGAINRNSGFTNLLPKKWAGFATHHGRALPTELSRRTRV
ncbi:MAG: hypothetical protein Q7R59_02130, partial [bacterium]|nr:hypothetical protein [bacterium]